MKIFYLAIFWLCSYSLVSAQSLVWSSLFEEQSTPGSSVIVRSEVVADEKIIIGGMFNVPVDFDPSATKSKLLFGKNQDLFFGKYSNTGELNWVKQLKSTNKSSLSGLAMDVSENIYLSGYFRDTIDLNPAALIAQYIVPNPNAEDFFLAKYNSTGNFAWARQISSTIHVRSKDLLLDNGSNLIVVGETRGTTDFDPGAGISNVTSLTDYLFVAKYNVSGSLVNAISMGTNNVNQKMHDVEVDGSGNIYIAGVLEGSVDFDPGSGTSMLTPNGNKDYFIAKYNSSLQYQWAYNIGGALAEDDKIDIEMVGAQLMVSGSYLGTVNLDLKGGTDNHTSDGNYDIFIARYNSSASLQSAVSIGGSGRDVIRDIQYYNADTIYFTGEFSGTVDFDPGTDTSNLISGGKRTLFFAAYNQNLDYKLASKISGTSEVFSSQIKVIESNPLVMGGIDSTGSADLNASWPTAPAIKQGPASFMARYQNCGDLIISASNIDAGCNQKTGSSKLTVSGGVAPYHYHWTSGDTTATADSLFAGTYYVAVKDQNHCETTSGPIIINDANGPKITVQQKINVSCDGGNDGAILLNVTGGAAPYAYSWSNGKTQKNVNALKAGLYEVTVTDNAKCKSSLLISITQPSALVVSSVASNPSCGNADGVLTALASGGVSPYSYQWTPGGSGGTQFSLIAGVYRVEVTDGNNCTFTQAISLSDDQAPNVSLDNVVDASCGGGGGAINISVSGGNPSYSYAWTPGGYSTQDISGLQPGEYDLIITDQSGCKAAFFEEIKAIKPKAPAICMVDVDSASGNAQVVWEKPVNQGIIDYYNVFRETTIQNVFDLVEDSIAFSQLSLFQDPFADTWARPWSYQLSYTDTCGIESEKSPQHTTIHTVVTANPQGDYNILWSRYKGNFVPNAYTCWRYTDVSGTDSVATWPASIYTYTDKNSPSSGKDVYYYMSVKHPTGCTATEATSKKSIRSNRGSLAPPVFGVGDGIVERSLSEYQIYPNPNNGNFRVDVSSVFDGIMLVQINDMKGNQVYVAEKYVRAGSNSINFEVNNISRGFYILQLDLNNERSFAKMMITGGE